jgi:hypothetical protein
MTRAPKTPQQKKELSLQRDRRNTYGENDKASRKAIPLRKALEKRRNRHKQNHALATLDGSDEAKTDLVESSARQDVYRVGGWTKAPDEPLHRVIQSKISARVQRVGRKSSKQD